jgi:CheY-like chemotaxis protein
VLAGLKKNPRTRHIPVHVITVVEKEGRAATLGAFAYLEKPVTKDSLDAAFAHISDFLEGSVRRLLLVDPDAAQAAEVSALVGDGDDVSVKVVSTVEGALQELETGDIDCMVIGLGSDEVDSLGLLEQVKRADKNREMPVVVYANKELTALEERTLRKYAESVVMKANTGSREQLLNDTAFFLHRIEDKLPPASKQLLLARRGKEASISGKTVLVIDDDIRNIFALTSVLEGYSVHVLHAENGRTGIEKLARHPEVDVILLDIMMPELDGYETMQKIRENPKYATLPIIAITAKALKEDREKCIQAGAFDYLPKPVEPDKLVELIRFWTRVYPKTGS